jgi:protein-S-isoprenylcysteine O-methyltransferase Ste14
MFRYLAALTLASTIATVLFRVVMLRAQGIQAMKFGSLDKTDFLIPPFALLYFYIVLAATFDWPSFIHHALFYSDAISWIGVLFCLVGMFALIWSLVSFGRSFRVGIDFLHPDMLITDGIFAFSRNPMYLAFAIILIGEFLILPNWITLVYVPAAVSMFHRQVLLEEEYLRAHYGHAYVYYCNRVRRYL